MLSSKDIATDEVRLAATRFWGRVETRAPDECWPWMLSKNRTGYGQFRLARTTVLAHRVAFWLGAGVDPMGLLVCHRCDNPPCCNPSHLFAGTSLDNVRDSIAKSRFAMVPQTHCRRGHELTAENTDAQKRGKYIRRTCRTCRRLRQRVAANV